MMMTASELTKADQSFPAITGNIEKDTETIVSELAVGTYVVERGMARLYLVWKTKTFLNLTAVQFTCKSCGFVYEGEEFSDDEFCPRCESGNTEATYVPLFPTLEAYLSHVADMTGKSRQTLFSRLRVYRVLCEERGVLPESVFKLTLLSSGAASKLASADEDADNVELKNDSWQETVDTAIGVGTKSGALEYIKYDVLKETKITAVISLATKSGTVFREYNDGEDKFVLEEYKFVLSGEWPDQVTDWLVGKLGAKAE